MESRYYSANDIHLMCEISIASAYRLIKKWNEELVSKGYDVPKRGYVVKSYANKKLYFSGE